ncbi:unnamed protein product [Gordionus sp. m RMFG-2023]
MYGQKPRRPLTLQNKIEDVLALPEVLAWNHKRSDRKGGKMLNPWIGPYLINKIFDKGVYELITTNNLILKTKYNLSNLKEFIVRNNEYPDENDSSSQNGLYDQIIPLAMEFVDPKSPRAAHVLPIDSGSQNVEFEDKNIQLDRDFINPKTPIELDDDILMINKLENIPRYFLPTTKTMGNNLVNPPSWCKLKVMGIVFIGRLV